MQQTTTDPWDVSEGDFPDRGSPEEQLYFLLNYAVLAPSSHNTQPWTFEIRDGAVELYADRTRALPVADPEDRALIVSCGAALFNLRVALRRFGYAAEVEVLPPEMLPDPDYPDLLAIVRPDDRMEPTEEDLALFRAIPERRTNRMPFEDRAVPESVLSALGDAAADEGARLRVVTGEEKAVVADLIAEGDRRQWNDKRFRRELAAWVHSNRTRRRDGMPGYAFGFGEIMSAVGPLVMRTFDMGNGRAATDRELAAGSPVLAALWTAEDDPRAWLSSGQALSKVLLRARTEGIYASYLNQPVEVPELRPKLTRLLGLDGYPQLLFRMGYGPQPRPTPRRPVEAVSWSGFSE